MKKIRMVSPAKQVPKEVVEQAAVFLREKGFEVEIAPHALGKHHYFSGTIAERRADFQAALDDTSVDVILCTRGGYGCVQFLDELDFSTFRTHPKLIAGYSDVTVFHHHISGQFGIPTLHCTAPLNFQENTTEALESLCHALNGVPNTYTFESHPLNRIGQVEAPVIGGNLAILYSLLGTDSDQDYEGKIVFIEEVGEAIYAVDRMFHTLRKAGQLAQAKALVVGGMTGMKDSEVPFGQSVEEVIGAHCTALNIPVAFGFPAGHIADNRAVRIGSNATLTITTESVTFSQENTDL